MWIIIWFHPDRLDLVVIFIVQSDYKTPRYYWYFINTISCLLWLDVRSSLQGTFTLVFFFIWRDEEAIGTLSCPEVWLEFTRSKIRRRDQQSLNMFISIGSKTTFVLIFFVLGNVIISLYIQQQRITLNSYFNWILKANKQSEIFIWKWIISHLCMNYLFI